MMRKTQSSERAAQEATSSTGVSDRLRPGSAESWENQKPRVDNAIAKTFGPQVLQQPSQLSDHGSCPWLCKILIDTFTAMIFNFSATTPQK